MPREAERGKELCSGGMLKKEKQNESTKKGVLSFPHLRKLLITITKSTVYAKLLGGEDDPVSNSQHSYTQFQCGIKI